MFFTTVTNSTRNIVSIAILFVMLFYQKDVAPSKDNDFALNQIDVLKHYQEKTIKNRIHIGFSKHSKIRLQQSTDDNRQL